jgi:hypothetical protein
MVAIVAAGAGFAAAFGIGRLIAPSSTASTNLVQTSEQGPRTGPLVVIGAPTVAVIPADASIPALAPSPPKPKAHKRKEKPKAGRGSGPTPQPEAPEPPSAPTTPPPPSTTYYG